jgi:hypothetical protein
LPGEWLVLLWLVIISTIAVRDLIAMGTVHVVVLAVPPLLVFFYLIQKKKG